MENAILRPIREEDRAEIAELIYISINSWYRSHGQAEIFRGGTGITDVFYEVYNDMTPGCNVVAINPDNGRIMGSCFYHPRKHHLSLGIMNVHPNYFGQGVGSKLLQHIIAYKKEKGFEALRLTQSAINIDSFSLYNKAGFVPRHAFQDFITQVPENGIAGRIDGANRVREATEHDIAAMVELEMQVSGISREIDYRYTIENKRGYWKVAIIDKSNGSGISGFMISCGHAAFNMLGPCIAMSEEDAIALLFDGLNKYPGRSPVCLVPMEKQKMVRQMYDWGSRVCEMHFCQVLGKFQPFDGISMPTFLPESG